MGWRDEQDCQGAKAAFKAAKVGSLEKRAQLIAESGLRLAIRGKAAKMCAHRALIGL